MMAKKMNEIQSALAILEQALQPSKITPEEISSFLKKFEVPDSLLGLYPVARRLMTIAPSLHRSDLKSHGFESHLRIAEAISALPDLAIPDFRNQPSAEHPTAFRGLYGPNPLYTLLGHDCANTILRRQYAVLVACFIPAYWRWRPLVENLPTYLPTKAGRTVRRFGELVWKPKKGTTGKIPLPGLEAILTQLPSQPTPFNKYADSIKSIIEHAQYLGLSEVEWESLSVLYAVFFGLVPDERTAKEVRRQQQRINGGSDIVGAFGEALPLIVPASFCGNEDVIVSIAQVTQKIDEGDGQTKHAPLVEFRIRSKEPVFSTRDDWLLILINRNRSDAYALDNQLFPFAFDVPNPHDAKHLLAELSKQTPPEARVIFLLLLVFVGLPRSETGRLQLTTGASLAANGSPTLNLRTRTVITKTFSAQSDMRLAKTTPERRVDRQSDFSLRLSRELARLLEAFISAHAIKPGAPVFANADKVIQDAMNLLNSLNRQHGTRLTMNRVAALRYVLIANKSDEAVAVLATGAFDARGYEPATYSSISHANLDHVVAQVTNHLCDLGGLGSGWRLKDLKDALQGASGSRLTPSIESMRELTANLKHSAKIAWQTRMHGQELIVMHNAFTNYVYASLVVGLGFRDVGHPILHRALIDSEGWCLISDKDDDTYYHTRMIRLPCVVASLIKELQYHNELLAQRLMDISWPEGMHLLRKTEQPLVKRSELLEQLKKDPLLFFWLDPTGLRLVISPERLLSLLPSWGLKSNSGRHFFRSRMRDIGCPDSTVRALMGHWRHGEEIFGRFSFINPRSISQALERWVEPMLADVGWTHLESPLRKH
jgi:hypothetical protein